MSNRIGPTGEFPRGKLSPDDEGGLNLAVTHADGKVLVKFGTPIGTPIAWLGLDPQDAANLAAVLIAHAREAARTSGTMVTVQL